MHRRFNVCVALLAIIAATVVAAAPGAGADDPDVSAVVPGEYLVELKPDGNAAAVAEAVGAVEPPTSIAGTRFARLVLDPAGDPAATLATLRNTVGVEAAQPNFVVGTADFLARRKFFADLPTAVVTTTTTNYRLGQTGLRNAGLPADGHAQGVVVAVLDTGVDVAHPRLAGRIARGGFDMIDRDAMPTDVGNRRDDNGDGAVDEAVGHGTFVAGLVTLVAPGSRVLPIRVLDSDGTGSTWTIMQGLAWATARRAQVANLSLGSPDDGEVFNSQLRSVQAAGMIVVAAAGNDASDMPSYPAGSDGVVGVAAIRGSSGTSASFTNFGSWIDVAGPGVAITSLYPGSRFATWGGTSAAAPVTSAALALISAAMPTRSVDDRVDRLTSTARPEGLDGLSSYGRVDIAAAVTRARQP